MLNIENLLTMKKIELHSVNNIKFRLSKRLSYKERREDALAPRAEEGRDKLRKAMGRSKYP